MNITHHNLFQHVSKTFGASATAPMTYPKNRWHCFRPLLAALLLFGARSLHAQATWSGLGADNNWSTVANWVGGTAPNASVYTDLQFSGSSRTSNINNYDGQIASITFNAGAGAFTLSGVSIEMENGTGITNNSSNLQTLSFSDYSPGLGGIASFSGVAFDAASGDLSVTSDISLGSHAVLTITGSHNTLISGYINNLGGGVGSLSKTGAGTLTLTGSSNYSGGTLLTAGTLLVGNNNALGTGTLVIDSGTFGSTVTAFLSNNINVAGDFTISGSSSIVLGLSGTMDLQAGTRTITGVGTGNGNNVQFNGTIQNGTGLTLTGTGLTGFTFVMGGTSNNTYTGLTTVTGDVQLLLNKSGGAVAVPGNLLVTNGGFVTFSATGQLSGTSVVTLDQGSLVSTVDVTTPNNVVLNPGGGTFFEDFNSTFTFNGTISGSGSLTQSGTGALVLGGSNTYGGGTFLNSGTLYADHNNALGTGTLTIANGTTLATHVPVTPGLALTNNIVVNGDFFIQPGGAGGNGITLDGNINLTGTTRTITNTVGSGLTNLSGVISDGGITFSSTQNQAVFWMMGSAANTYTGLTTINDKVTLLLQRSAVNQTIVGDILVNPGGVLIDDNPNQIADTATVTVNSAGNSTSFGTLGGFFLNGNNETIGAISGTGTVQLQDQSLTHGGILTIGAGTFSGVISDAGLGGQIVKTGTGTLLLAGANTYNGNTTINGGLLQVDGTIASANTVVNAGGTLGGTGKIGGNVSNGGFVSPGDSPGTLTISGNYMQTAAGTLVIQIAGLAPGEHDLLVVGGSASLSGTLQLVQLNHFQLHAGDKLTILTAAGGVTGKFNTVDTGTILDANVVYDPQDVSLELQVTQGSFFSFAALHGLTPNQLAVARNLDRTVGDIRGTVLIDFLDNVPLRGLPADFDLISPEELTSIFEISRSFAGVQDSNIQNHLADVRNQTPQGVTVANITFHDGKNTVGLVNEAGSKNIMDKNATPPVSESRWNVFMEGSGEFVRVNSDLNAGGYDFTTAGVTIGGDYRVNDHFAIGLMAGYANTGSTLANNGSVDVNSGKAGIYSTIYGNGFYLDMLAAGGYNSYGTHRLGLGGIAQGSTEGGEFDGLIGGGYDIHAGNFTVGPIASVQYTYVAINGFNEAGSLAPLHIGSQNQDSLRSNVGFKVAYDYVCPGTGIKVTPSVAAAWQHDYLNSAWALDSQFASGAGGVFTVRGPVLGRDSVMVNAGVTVQWTQRLGTYIYYNGDLGRKNYQLNSVSGGARIAF